MAKAVRKPKEEKAPDGCTIKIKIDEQGNKIIATENATLIKVELKLVSEKKRRLVGFITKSTRTMNMLRTRGIHLHRKSNSYGFNYKIIAESLRFETISLQDDYCRWKFNKSIIIDNPNFLFFKQQGFELQTFLSLEDLAPFKVLSVL